MQGWIEYEIKNLGDEYLILSPNLENLIRSPGIDSRLAGRYDNPF
jgi:hypothetical protein